ncbi:hypothetical protein [Anaerofustis sp.]|uniref:hypothetical protein n=1 Tax=Anaerofustis sp. TaxID=1872517 RepID=UPI0025C2B3B7|nr:hypothetical protein [Anaerofustis sp.]
MSLKDRIAMHNREKEEKKQARLRKKIEKKKTIEPMTREQIEECSDLVELFKEKIEYRAKCLETKRIVDANITNKDIITITDIMLEDFNHYKDLFLEFCKSGSYELKYSASVICLRTGFNTNMALDNLKYFARHKKTNGVIAYESREILKRYNEKRLPSYEGFEVQYKN